MLPFSLSDIPLISRYIGVLVVLEGLLSADNALVLALMVRHLPRSEQKRVLRIGIWGAIGFRFIAVLLSAVLIKFWIFKVLGGGYLLYLAIRHFAGGESGQESGPRGWQSTFWGTVAAVTFADIAFSIDSIVAAVGMAEDFPAQFGDRGKVFIVFVGGVLGIITMRFVVRYFILLLDKFPGLAQGAYVLVAWIGLKLLINGLYSATPTYVPFHINEVVFWGGMLAITVLSFVIKPGVKSPEMAEGLRLLEEEESMIEDEPRNGEVTGDHSKREEAAHHDQPDPSTAESE
jgi:YkoY family integral membrane protein